MELSKLTRTPKALHVNAVQQNSVTDPGSWEWGPSVGVEDVREVGLPLGEGLGSLSGD